MKRESLQTFNDGVIAIIVTLMVLNIHLPGLTRADFGDLLVHVGIYALSFVLVAIFWMNLHALLDPLPCLGHAAAWLDLALLFFLSLTPLPTQALGEHPGAVASHAFFGATLTAAAVAYAALHAAVAPDLSHVSDADKRTLHRKNVVATALFAASVPLAWVSPWASGLIFVAVPAMYFLPSRRIVLGPDA